jgi:hypothetical protein
MMSEENNNIVNVNINLQKSNNYVVILKGDKQFNSKDVTFYIKNFKVPSLTIYPANVDVNQNIIYFPSQGRMDYEKLSLDVMVDDNLNSYLELVKWMNRLKDPEKLLTTHYSGYDPDTFKRDKQSLKQILEKTNQYPIEYRDIDIMITDRNHRNILKFTFVDAWVDNVSGLELNAQNSEYLSFNSSFYYLYMKIFNENGTQIVPPLDTEDRAFN